MFASWPAIVLLVVAQTSDEFPERLPPVPGEYAAGLPAATWQPANSPPPSFAPRSVSQVAIPPFTEHQSWSPQQANALALPPPPDSPLLTESFGSPYDRPPPSIDDATWDAPELPGTRISFATLGAGTGFSTTTLDINHTWLMGYGEAPPISITPGWGIHFWGDGVGLSLPARVYDFYADLQWTPWTGEKWSVSVGLTPGLYTDFAHASGDMFQLTGWVVGNRQLSAEWQLVLGAAYIRQLQSTLVPVGGVIWTPSEDIRLELIFPKPKYAVRYRESEAGSVWWFVAGQLGGGAWSVADGPGNDALVGYSDIRLVVGLETYYVNGREWSLELGYAFDRQLWIDNQHAASVGSAISLSASMAF